MLKNYFRIAWRNLFKSKSPSIINISGADNTKGRAPVGIDQSREFSKQLALHPEK